MLETINEVRPSLSPFAPKVKMLRINPEKIRDVIGSGGKIITEIIKDCNDVKIDIEQDGRVFIMHSEVEWIEKAAKRIENLTREAIVGEVYTGQVVKIEKFGAFVELWPGCDGLVHISKLANKKVAKVEDELSLGDVIAVKVIGIDEKGRINLSRKDVINNTNNSKIGILTDCSSGLDYAPFPIM